MSGRLRIPVATYRLQFNKGFRIRDAAALVAYLDCLGISDIYASPILKARQGSSHGYDVTDPTCFNPELGTARDFETLIAELRQHNMGLLLDIVPNHMAASPENPWWRDVLEQGKASPFAGFFDTGWLDFNGSSHTSVGYRRFFDIGDLIGVRVEEPPVFEATHSLIIHLIDEGKVTGLRLDHIDGLYDPLGYLLRLQRRIAPWGRGKPGFFVVVEKILSGDETLREDWPVFGTTGYDFAKMLDTLYVDGDGMESLKNVYSQAAGVGRSFRDLVYYKKKQVMLELFSAETAALGDYLAHLSGRLAAQEASTALVEVTACLPVYRTYVRSTDLTPDDRRYLEAAVQEAVNRSAALKAALLFLKRVLLLDFPAGISLEEKTEWMNFVRRWQQLTGAIMAKGFEDTALYNYNCLVSLNEVGGSPDASGLSIQDFHEWNRARHEHWPDTMNATSTHDTKRSEDVRARVHILSEVPDEWHRRLKQWQDWNRTKKLKAGALLVPEPNTEILLYQTLVGAWPISAQEVPKFRERLKAYIIKATREAKAHTSWLKINEKYEVALLSFIDSILEDSADNKFLCDFLPFQAQIAYYGFLNSIARVLLKATLPGIPDFYQGTELWDFSLVDPDNRRPVDWSRREKLLDALVNSEEKHKLSLSRELLAAWQDGRVKLYVTYKALNTRRIYCRLFQKGNYLPLTAAGDSKEQICAFARHHQGAWVLTAAPRFFTQLSAAGVPPVGEQVWAKGRIILPDGAPRRWLNAFTGEVVPSVPGESALSLAAVFSVFPVALLIPPS